MDTIINAVLFGILGTIMTVSLGLDWQDWQVWAVLAVAIGIFANGAFLNK